MARPEKQKFTTVREAHRAIVEANEEIRTAMMQTPPADETAIARYSAVEQQFRILDKGFTALEHELDLFKSKDAEAREKSRLSTKDLLALMAEARQNIGLLANIIQRKQELNAQMTRDELIKRIADKVPIEGTEPLTVLPPPKRITPIG